MSLYAGFLAGKSQNCPYWFSFLLRSLLLDSLKNYDFWIFLFPDFCCTQIYGYILFYSVFLILINKKKIDFGLLIFQLSNIKKVWYHAKAHSMKKAQSGAIRNFPPYFSKLMVKCSAELIFGFYFKHMQFNFRVHLMPFTY